jgi:hypothetical protein
LILSLAMLALFSLIVSSVILVAIIVIDQPVWRVASMAAISLGLLFLVLCHKHLNPLFDSDSLRGWNTMNCDSCSSGRLASNCSG